MTNTTAVFPHYDTIVKQVGSSTTVQVSTWVRLKRQGIWYEVLVAETQRVIAENPKELIQALSYITQKFIAVCTRTQFLWAVPDATSLAKLIKAEHVKISLYDLTDKEYLLLHTRL